ncbi:hypothetical protein GCM10020331_066440 [Ectobacillus funiculus]
MGKRAWISLPIIIVLLAGIAATVILGNTKIDATNVKDAKRIAAYAEPAVVQVYNYAVINWDFFSCGSISVLRCYGTGI